MKKLDHLLITSFLPPFVVTFFIALFVFVMQTLWLYIDDIAGKGVGFLLLVELVAYMSVSMIPLALPVAVLISSVMVMGNLAERYELSSIKSAGVSLWRTMRPLMVVTSCIGVFSFFCSNYFIPVSNLKFKSRLHDIKNQKPALSLEESIFNEDFKGFAIRIGDKEPDGQTIKDVMMFDNEITSDGRLSLVAADSGRMFGSEDGHYFVMQLYEGSQISEPKPTTKQGRRNYPMMRIHFDQWTKVFNLDEFELDRTDEQLFKSHHTMLSNRQLLMAIDSIDKHLADRTERFDEQTNRHFYFWEQDWAAQKREERLQEAAEAAEEKGIPPGLPHPKADTTRRRTTVVVPPTKPKVMPPQAKPTRPAKPPVQANRGPDKPEPDSLPAKPERDPKKSPWPQTLPSDLTELPSFAESFGQENRREAISKALGTTRTIRDQAQSTANSLVKTKENRVKHVFEFHSKFSLAMACLIFLFVGAPMGAIVRKGGFGWPLLISIIFFMLFIVLGIFSKNIAERFVINADISAWVGCLVIFPMGLLLTYWAMRDMGWSQIVDFFKINLPKLKR